MLSRAALRTTLLQALDRVHLDADAAREAVLMVAEAAEQTAADPLYPLACYVMGRAALATEDHALAQKPLLQAMTSARAGGELELAVHAAAALDCARAPHRFVDSHAQQAAEHVFAQRLAAGVDRMALIAERVRLDVYRSASACEARALIQHARLGLGSASVLSVGWCVESNASLADVLGARPAHWALRVGPLLLTAAPTAGVICDVDGPLWPQLRLPIKKEPQ
jgi:hypothetical protein